MNCDHEKLVAYVLGDLDQARSAEFAAHVATCPACAERMEELRHAVGVLRSLPEPDARPVVMSDLGAAIEAEEVRASITPSPASPPRRRWRWGFALAAAAILAVVCFRYGVTIKVGQMEVALGGGRGAAIQKIGKTPMDQESVRGVVREELVAQIQPALLQLAQTISDLDAGQRADLVSLRNAFILQRESDMNEVKRNFGLFASTVNETLGIR